MSGRRELKPDPPIIGRNSPTNQALGTLSTQLMWAEVEKIDENRKAIEDHFKIHELRKSCGVPDSEQAKITIRRPPRYGYLGKPWMGKP